MKMPHDSDPHSPNQPRRFSWKQPAIYLMLPIVGAGAALMGDRWLASSNPMPAVQPALAQAAEMQVAQSRTGAIVSATDPNFIAAAVERVGPAVVRINSSRTVKTQIPPIFNDPFFRQFFGSELPDTPSTRVERGTGSGFIIGEGLILTNSHVVNGADTVSVKLKDGREFQGKVLGQDPVTDVAVVKIQATNLPVVTLGKL